VGLFRADTKTIMMDPAVKTGMAVCVLLVGVCAAMLFRREPPVQIPSAPSPAAPLLIHSGADAVAGEGQPQVSVSQRLATVVKPLDIEKSPPPLAAKYPETDRSSDSRRGVSIDLLLPATEARTHKIIDGDTLAALAQRYLGSTARAGEIFEANRAVLSDPELLPIGAELKIPAIDSRRSRR
jgi:nucleoid-associated protein YgaU